jgi:hypothetical protein
MQYKFVQNREDYEKYAAGGVLFAAPGHTAFPIRLSNEIFERCMAFRESEGESRPCILYDPCCGSAYHLTTLAYFNWNKIQRIIGSDINPEALSLAARNLSLLKLEGIDKRIEELSSMLQQFGKESHATSSKNAVILRQELSGFIENHTIETHLFRADATDSAAVSAGLSGIKVDVVITDIPYGQHSQWQFDSRISASTPEPLHQMLDSLLSVLSSKAIVAIAAAKDGRIAHERYEQLKKVKTGKRQVVFLKPNL